MKITRRQLRRIIREGILKEYGDRPPTPLHEPGEEPLDWSNRSGGYDDPGYDDRGLGWADFQGMAQTGDYEGAGQWLQDLARDRGLTIDREVEDMMIEMSTDEYTTAENLESEWEEIMDQLSGASARTRPWEHN